MESFGKFMAVVLAMIISPIISGFVILKLWGWFVVPTFETQPLRLVEAIGLMYLINYLKAKRDKEVQDKFWKEFTANLIFVIVFAPFALFAGWIVSLFM